MQIRVTHSDAGSGMLTTDHAAASYGQPVLVLDEGGVYGPGDWIKEIHDPQYGCLTLGGGHGVPANAYLHRTPEHPYAAEELAWIDDYIVRSTAESWRHESTWHFGASLKTAEQLAEVERRIGKRLPLA